MISNRPPDPRGTVRSTPLDRWPDASPQAGAQRSNAFGTGNRWLAVERRDGDAWRMVRPTSA